MSANALFWYIGSKYFTLLNTWAFNGVSILCYILGTYLIVILISNLTANLKLISNWNKRRHLKNAYRESSNSARVHKNS